MAMVLAAEVQSKARVLDSGIRLAHRDSRIRRSWKRVELTSTDWLVLRYCNEQKFLSYEQACAIFGTKAWHKYPTDPVDKQLRKLAHFGLVRRERVYTERRAIILLGREGHLALVQANRDRGLGFAGAVDLRTFPHDRTLTDLRMQLEVTRLRGEWRSERILRRITGSQVVPDGDFISRATGRRIAVELEQARKSVERYRRILRRHLRSPYEVVLYVVRDTGHLRWLASRALPRLEQDRAWGIDQPPTAKLRLVLLDELLAKGAEATVLIKPAGSQIAKLRMEDL